MILCRLSKMTIAGSPVSKWNAVLVSMLSVSVSGCAFLRLDPLIEDQWHLHNTGQNGGKIDADVGGPEAWSYTFGDSGVLIAVIDDAIDVDHPDLKPNVWGGWDLTVSPPDTDPSPTNGEESHGTAVTGVAAARGFNDLGVSGICPYCSILAIRIPSYETTLHAEAFDYAVLKDADVIIFPRGYPSDTVYPSDVASAINNAKASGAVIFIAMPNTFKDACAGATPDISSLDSVVAVSGSTNLDLLSGNFGFGDCMDLVAPTSGGTLQITTTDIEGPEGLDTGDYASNFGDTSSAAPLAAGVAGLVLSINDQLTPDQVQALLQYTAERINPGTAQYDPAKNFKSFRAGYGRVDAARALVPNVQIFVEPESPRVNERFAVTVRGSAPFGLDTLAWSTDDTGVIELDTGIVENLNGEVVFTKTWSGLQIPTAGTFTISADARDTRFFDPVPGYPHEASQVNNAVLSTQIVVEP